MQIDSLYVESSIEVLTAAQRWSQIFFNATKLVQHIHRFNDSVIVVMPFRWPQCLILDQSKRKTDLLFDQGSVDVEYLGPVGCKFIDVPCCGAVTAR